MSKDNLPERRGNAWSMGEVRALKKWVKNGVTVGLIARRLLRTEFAISCAITKHCPTVEEMPSKRLIINGRDYDRILNVAMDNFSSRIFLNAEISAACQGVPGNIKFTTTYYGSPSTKIRGF